MSNSQPKSDNDVDIQHLVFSGGGPAGLMTYGACRRLHENKVWELKKIKSIYGTSIGALMGVIISLGYEWSVLDDYLIKRPWNKVFKLSFDDFLNCFYEKGLLGSEVIYSFIGPLLKAKELDITITFGQLYDYTGIELHMYTTNINSSVIELIDLSHITHKDLTICDGLCMSMSYPFIFKPVIIDTSCYVDGGILNNFPLNNCMEQQKCDQDNILAFKITLCHNDETIKNDSSMADYIYVFFKKLQRMIFLKNSLVTPTTNGKYTVNCIVENLTEIGDWMNVVLNEDSRSKLITEGDSLAIKFYSDFFTHPVLEKDK